MQKRTCWEFVPTEVSLAVIPGRRGHAVSKAEMRVKTNTGPDLNIVLHRPRLTAGIHADLNELAADLADVTGVKCFRQPVEGGMVQCRVEFWREDSIEIVGCGDIEGLPE